MNMVRNAQEDTNVVLENILRGQTDAAPLVSIIVPVYNVENYLSRCLESLIAQTYRNIEILCINDGSTDGSVGILEKYAEKDDRIRVHDKENGGLSSARNMGIDLSRGVYISFVDSDDWIDSTAIEKCVERMTGEVDLVCYGAELVNAGVDESVIYASKQYHDIRITGLHEMSNEVMLKSTYTVWNKLFKTELLKKYDIRFVEGRLFEDDCFSIIYMMHCRCAYYLDEYLYYYVRRSNSILDNVLSGQTEKTIDYIYTFDIIYQHSIKYQLAERFEKILRSRYHTHLRLAYRFAREDSREKVRKLATDFAQSYDEKYIDTPALTYVKQKQYAKVRELNELIVCLASTQAYIETAYLGAESVLNQTLRADKVILWLAEEEFPHKEEDLPDALKALKIKGLTIEWKKGAKSNKKLIPTLRKYPNAVIVTAADNVIYEKTWLRDFFNQHIEDGANMLGYSMIRLISEKNYFKFLDRRLYMDASGRYYDSLREPTPFNRFKSESGVLYPPHSLHPDVLNDELMMELVGSNEDVWGWLQGVRNGSSVRIVGNGKAIQKYVPVAQEGEKQNNNGSDNKVFMEQFYKTLAYYPDLKAIFAEESKRNAELIDSIQPLAKMHLIAKIWDIIKKHEAYERESSDKFAKLQEEYRKEAEAHTKAQSEARAEIAKLQEAGKQAAEAHAQAQREAKAEIVRLQEEGRKAANAQAKAQSEAKAEIAKLQEAGKQAAEAHAQAQREAKAEIVRLQEEGKKAADAQAEALAQAQREAKAEIAKLQEAGKQAAEAHALAQRKAMAEIVRLQEEYAAECKKHAKALAKLKEEQKAASSMMREVALLPFTWLSLQRCRVAQHFTWGKIHAHYTKKKKQLRERVQKAVRFLTSK